MVEPGLSCAEYPPPRFATRPPLTFSTSMVRTPATCALDQETFDDL